jgi:hypothetical protein
MVGRIRNWKVFAWCNKFQLDPETLGFGDQLFKRGGEFLLGSHDVQASGKLCSMLAAARQECSHWTFAIDHEKRQFEGLGI